MYLQAQAGRDLKDITDDQLIEAWKLGTLGRDIYNNDQARVVKVTSTAIMKVDLSIEAEVANMEEILKKSDVRLPQVYRTLSNGQAEYIVMEYINGERLDTIEWQTRTEQQRQHIKNELKQAFISLAHLHSTVPGPVKNIAQGRLFSVYGAHTKFSSMHELEEWLTAKLFGEGSLIGEFDRLIMCHMDLNQRNLILDNAGRLFFLDWGHAGYYPPEFQEAILLYDARSKGCAWTRDLLEVYREVHGVGKSEVLAKLVRVLENNAGPRGASHLLNGEQGVGPFSHLPVDG
ncbi:kinase-like domain-containing protein [Xylogone sp. PMI_703]|nr:kinase-like domain-containing protein [Xylogone sp. PMI_703]